MTSAYAQQVAFRGRDDTQTLNSTTWNYAQNTNFSWAVDSTFRLRFEVEEINTKNFNLTNYIEYNRNGGGWNQITPTSSVVKNVTSSQFTEGDSCTDQLTGSSRTYSGGYGCTDGYPSAVLISNAQAEDEFSLQIVGADVNNGDTIQIRFNGLNGWVVTPTVTVIKVDNGLTAQDVFAGTPTVDAPTAGQTFTLIAQDIFSGVPEIDQPTLNQGADNDLTAQDIFLDVPTVDSPTLVQNAITAQDIYAGVPTVDQGAMTSAIWNVDFDEGDLSDVAGQVGTGISVTTGSALGSSAYGLNINTVDGSDDYVYPTTITPNTSGIWRARFYLDTNNLTMVNGYGVWILGLYSGADRLAIGKLIYTSDQYRIQGTIYNDAAAATNTSAILISEGVHWVEFELKRATNSGSNDGYISISVDGGTPQTASGIDNYDICDGLDTFRFGGYNKSPSYYPTGNLFVDELIIRDDGLSIGEKPNQCTAQDITSDAPTIDQPTLDQAVGNTLTAQDITSGVPTIDEPSLVQNALLSQDVFGGIATIDTPALAQLFGLTAQDIYADPPTVDQATLDQNILTSQDVFLGVPTIDQPTANQTGVNECTAQDITGGVPTVDQAALSLIQALTSQDITSGVPAVDQAVLAQLFDLVAQDILGSDPTIDEATLAQIFALVSQDIASGIPTIDQPTANQTGVNECTAQDITAGIPTIDQPTLILIQALTSQDITGNPPTIDQPSIAVAQAITAQDITAGVPVIDQTTVSQTLELTSQDITSGIPVIDEPTMTQTFALVAQDVTSGIPVIDNADLVLVQILGAQDITSGVPTIDKPMLLDADELWAADIFFGVPTISVGDFGMWWYTPAVRVLEIGQETRTLEIEAEDRTYVIPAEDRTVKVER